MTHSPYISGNAKYYKWLVFFSIAIGTFISVVDHGSVLVALPVMQTHFGSDLPAVQWVVTGYLLTISALLLPMGRLGDYLGKNRIYILGLIIFAVASFFASISSDLIMVILSKILQGAGSAMIQGNAIAIIVSTFPAAERGKALGSHLSVVGTGLITGPALGGLLVDLFGWKSVFIINIPVALIAVAAAVIIMGVRSEESIDLKNNPFDWKGSIISTIFLIGILLLFNKVTEYGWNSFPILAGGLILVCLLILFIVVETKVTSPMLDVKLFTNPIIGLGFLSSWISFFGTGGVRFIMPFYMQKILNLEPLVVGLSMIPPAICMALLSPMSGYLSDKFGWKAFTILGLSLSIVACLSLSIWVSDSSPLIFLIPMLMLQTSGNGIFNSPNNSSILNEVDNTKFGVMSAMTQLVRNSANVISMSVTTSIIVISFQINDLGSNLDNITPEMSGAFMTGLHATFFTLFVVLSIGLIATIIRK